MYCGLRVVNLARRRLSRKQRHVDVGIPPEGVYNIYDKRPGAIRRQCVLRLGNGGSIGIDPSYPLIVGPHGQLVS